MQAKEDLPYLEWTEPDTGAVQRFYADLVVTDGANLPAQATAHAVETGSKISDHYRKDLETAKIQMFFSGAPIRGDLDPDNPGTTGPVDLKYPPNQASGAPLYTPGGLFQAAGGALSSLLQLSGPAQPKTVQALTFARATSRLEQAIELIRRFQTEGILVTARTTFGLFTSMAIVNAAPSRTYDTGEGGMLDLDLQQLRFVTSDIALATPLPAEPRAQGKKTSSTSGSTAEDGAAKRSILKALADAANAAQLGGP